MLHSDPPTTDIRYQRSVDHSFFTLPVSLALQKARFAIVICLRPPIAICLMVFSLFSRSSKGNLQEAITSDPGVLFLDFYIPLEIFFRALCNGQCLIKLSWLLWLKTWLQLHYSYASWPTNHLQSSEWEMSDNTYHGAFWTYELFHSFEENRKTFVDVPLSCLYQHALKNEKKVFPWSQGFFLPMVCTSWKYGKITYYGHGNLPLPCEHHQLEIQKYFWKQYLQYIVLYKFHVLKNYFAE